MSRDEFDARLAEKGLRIEARGRGLVVTDGKETVKASSVAPELSRRNLEQRFGALHGERRDTEQSQRTRERMRHANEMQALPPETLERLLNLPDRLSAAVEAASRTLEETTGRTASTLQHTVPETADRSTKRMVRATRRLAKQQHALAETEQSLAYTIERLRRQADRAQWMQTGVIVLARIAGMLGGTAAAFVILNWTR